MKTDLHVVSFDLPYPPNYGGAIDVYYKIKKLSQLGVNIRLHAFSYGREYLGDLGDYCEVHLYKRKTNIFRAFTSSKPYIVESRNNKELLNALLTDKAPILFEGLHTTFYLGNKKLKRRFKAVRTHNIEHDYYAGLEKAERNPLRRLFFRLEAERLKKHESALNEAQQVFAISKNDCKYFKKKYGKVKRISAFHSNEEVKINSSPESFALYHGNLGVGENREAAEFLIQEVFSRISYPFIIAGSKAGTELRTLADRHPNIDLKENLSTSEIDDLIWRAKINILPTFQATGIKLKLINVLYKGHHVIANKPMVVNTGLEELVNIADSSGDIIKLIEALNKRPLTEAEKELRRKVLSKGFGNELNAEKIIRHMKLNQPA